MMRSPILELDDGTKVYLSSYAGGAHGDFCYSHIGLRFVHPDGTEAEERYMLERHAYNFGARLPEEMYGPEAQAKNQNWK